MSAAHAAAGLWFHAPYIDEHGRKQVNYQGQILRVRDGIAACQMYSALDGSPTTVRMFAWHDIDVLEGWKLYATSEQMRESFEKMRHTGWTP